jgi:taurine--2-oxoglutarate transaminase
VLVRESLAQHFDTRALPCGHTYSGHPLAIAAANAALDVYESERLFERAREIEQWIHEDLAAVAARARVVGDARGIGAFWAVELVKDRETREPIVPWQGPNPGPIAQILAKLRDRAVYAFGRYNIILITPPLTIAREELREGIGTLGDILEEFTGA